MKPSVANATSKDFGERRSEARVSALISVVILLVLFALLPNPLVPSWVSIAGTLALMLPLLIINPLRFEREEPWSRWVSIALASFLALICLINVVDVAMRLLNGSRVGLTELLMAMQVWLSLILCFGIIYWELDRGGPVRRGTLSREQLPDADFLFPQDQIDDNSPPEVARSSAKLHDWRASFIDYLFISVTTMIAYSPTDTMPLTSRAKFLMSVQSIAGYLLFALVIARAVGILS